MNHLESLLLMVRFAAGDSKLRKARLIVIEGKLLLRHLQKGKQNHRGWQEDHLHATEIVTGKQLFLLLLWTVQIN